MLLHFGEEMWIIKGDSPKMFFLFILVGLNIWIVIIW